MTGYRESGVGYAEPDTLYTGGAPGNYRSPTISYNEPDTTYRGLTAAPPIPLPSVVTGEYRYVISDLSGTRLDEIPAQNPQWSYVLNGVGTATFVLPMMDPKCDPDLLAPGKREVRLYKGDDVVWGGHLWTAQGSTGEGDESVRFSCEDWLGMMNRRDIDRTLKYKDEEQFDIAWGLIDYTQNQTDGDIGITRATVPKSGVKRDRTYPFWERAKVGQELIGLTEVGRGFDFEITPEKQFIAYYPSKGSSLPFPYELGHNIGTLSQLLDASDMATEYSVIGAGDGASTCIAIAISPTARAEYGLLQQNESMTDIKTFTTLQDRADAMLELRKRPRREPQLSAFFYTENPYTNKVGDRVRVKADHGYIQVDDVFRIISLTFQLTNDGRESVTVAFDSLGQA